jgi:glutathione S-transferase
MIKLYHCPLARSIRPLWALEELGLKYDLRSLPFPPSQDDALAAENPLGTVPLLIDGQHRLNESVAMCQYLAVRGGVNDLGLSADHPEYPAWLNWIMFGEASLTYPITLVLHYGKWYDALVPGSPIYPDVVEYYGKKYLSGLGLVDRALVDSDFLVARRFTVADISVGYNFVLLEHLGLMDDLPRRVMEYWARLKDRPAFKAAIRM